MDSLLSRLNTSGRIIIGLGAIAALVLVVGFVWLNTVERSEAACNLPSGGPFTGVVDVSPPATTVPNFYTPTVNLLSDAALGWLGYGGIGPFSKRVTIYRKLVCCPSTIPEPNYGVWEHALHRVDRNVNLTPSWTVGALPAIIGNVVGAATGAGVDAAIVTQLQAALNVLSITFAGVDLRWIADFYKPESDRDDCNGCGYNARWAGSEKYQMIGSIGNYSNSSWAGGTVFNVSVTLLEAEVYVYFYTAWTPVSAGSPGGAGTTYKYKKTRRRMLSKYQFALGPVMNIPYVDDVNTVVDSSGPYCKVTPFP